MCVSNIPDVGMNAARHPLRRSSRTLPPRGAPRVVSTNPAARKRLPVLILPGFLSNNTTSPSSQYTELAQSLLALEHPAAEILPATTWDWAPTLSGGSFLWYLQRLAAAVNELHCRFDSQVCLVGVSAGGWLARLALGEVPYNGETFGLAPLVHTLVTLGTPHQSLEAYPFGRAEEAWICKLGLPADITTSLQYANYHYPDAHCLQPTNVACVCGSAVCGRTVTASEVQDILAGRQTLRDIRNAWFIQSAYVANCGDPSVDGDGVTPIQCSLLPGAQQLVLPGVWHNAAPGKLWYGTQGVVEQWDSLLP